MALWFYDKYTVIEEPYYSDWEPFSFYWGPATLQPNDRVGGHTEAPEWWFDEYIQRSGEYVSMNAMEAIGTALYGAISNGELECSYLEIVYSLIDEYPPMVRADETRYGMRREILYYNDRRGIFMGRITAEEGTYPDDGRSGDYWYVAIGPAWTPPDLRLRVGGALKTYSNGWVKVGGQLREINKMWTKVNGVLKEVKEQ